MNDQPKDYPVCPHGHPPDLCSFCTAEDPDIWYPVKPGRWQCFLSGAVIGIMAGVAACYVMWN